MSSYDYILKKIKGKILSALEIREIIKDTVNGKLSDVELAALITAIKIQGMTNEEIINLTQAEVSTGDLFDFGSDVYDKHSTGGVPGNKVSLIIVPIVAAAGLIIPKTSTRAITSPSGTADSMEVLAPVKFKSDEVKKMIKNNGACIILGGHLETAPADSILIKIEKNLHLDPFGLMIPSILAKKMSMGVKKLVLDIPCGKGTKFKNADEGRKFALFFKEISREVKIDTECALTNAIQPIGHCVGPAIEAREALHLLYDYKKGPNSLIEKSTDLAGILLEMGGKAQQGTGQQMAKNILKSGRALEKMKEIIEIQEGNPNIKPEDIEVGPEEAEFFSAKSGYVTDIDNSIINKIAKTAGCPQEKLAGVQLFKKIGALVKEGDLIFKIYAKNSSKLEKATKIFNASSPVILGGMIIERI
ncbi:MAG: AMP phosphorylase [Candidatus Lokiarchaeota archaeon]|nr:AMP phosphorylase [Candidatus Lokiarchaeota archaeon]